MRVASPQITTNRRYESLRGARDGAVASLALCSSRVATLENATATCDAAGISLRKQVRGTTTLSAHAEHEENNFEGEAGRA